MKHKVLQYGRLMSSLEKQLAEAFEWHRLVDESDPKAFLAARGRDKPLTHDIFMAESELAHHRPRARLVPEPELA